MIFMSLEQQIKDKALALGFDAAGITDAAPISPEHVAHLEAWLRSGYAGRMDYMHRHLEKRIDPARLLDGARSVIVVALNYKPRESMADGGSGHCERSAAIRMADSSRGDSPLGRVAQYAQYEDYHPFIKSRLRALADVLRLRTDGAHRFRLCVDSAPLAEKALAVRAGLGFIGRNHLLIHPRLGPQILLGEIVTTAALRPDEPVGGSCGQCNRCLQACPTGALRPDGFLDARRCTSYLTQYGAPEEWNDGIMEYWSNGGTPPHHSTVPPFQYPNPLRGWLFGCDECLLACPYQRNAPPCANSRFRWYHERAALNPRAVLAWTPEEFEARFHDSPLRRLGLENLQHNARLCRADRVP